MVTDIANAVEKELGEHMPDAAWQAVTALWSSESFAEAYPDKAPTSLTGIKCKNCRKGHKCQHKGKDGHLPNESTTDTQSENESSDDELDVLDENVKQCLRDMAKPGARTTWAGWFPKSFSKLLTSFDISAATAHKLALSIRLTITHGMDEIWRERNAAQHQPKERKEINDKITTAFETRTQLGIDTSPHSSAKDIHALPFRIKAKWLENSNTKIEARVEHDKKRTLAANAFKKGRAPKWNAEADKPTTKRKTRTTKGTTKETTKETDKSINPWSLSSAAASRASPAPARPARTAAAAAPAAAAAAAPSPSTANIALEPSIDLQRTPRDMQGQQRQADRPDQETTRGREHKEPHEEPATPKTDSMPRQGEGPETIDDVR